MSVQAGMWYQNGKHPTREQLGAISDQMAEYGPDCSSVLLGREVAILYRGYHTTTESCLEHQPYRFANDKLITWDGRLDNRVEMEAKASEELKSDTTDVGIVAASFQRFGTGCFRMLLGDWALSVWDPNERELILARSHMGVRTLFYHMTSDRIVWCSLLHPLATLGEYLTPCDEYFAGFLSFHPDADLTPYAQIRSVLPAHFVRMSKKKVITNRFWTPSSCPSIKGCKTDGDFEEQFRHYFRQSVRRCLRTNMPVLADLSGGLDSSSIVCMADSVLEERNGDGPRMDTISYYNLAEPDADDHEYFTQIEQRRGRKGHHLDLAEAALPFQLQNSDFVAVPGLGMAPELEEKLREITVSGGYRVSLSGVGGDELLGQALDPRVQAADLIWRFKIGSASRQLAAWSLISRRPWIHLFLRAFTMTLPPWIRVWITKSRIEPWIKRDFARQYGIAERLMAGSDGSWLAKPSRRDSLHTVASLARQISCARPSRLEKRYPYLDRDLMEFLISVPTDQILRPGERRSLMRRSLRGLVPDKVLTRRTKAGATRCYSILLEKSWPAIQARLESALSEDLGYVDLMRFQSDLLAAKNGLLSPYFLRLLKGLSLEFWLQDAFAHGVFSNRSTAAPNDIPESRLHLAGP